MTLRVEAIIIDPQMDFCDHPSRAGSLAVPGAHADMQRLAGFLEKNIFRLDDIHVTLDSHHVVDIAHPIWWKDQNGNAPAPFTMITADMVRSGLWSTRNPAVAARSLAYVETLEAKGRYQLVIWPEHCLIGSQGHSVHPDVHDALLSWDRKNFGMFNAVTKGSNPFTEHYSGVQAEVPDANDPSTQLNMSLIDTLQQADLVIIAGEALSHCVANTVRDIAANFDPASISKLVLLEDTCSPVPSFEKAAQDFINDMTRLGMRLEKTTTFNL
jgi:nicotinamidase/pyrazinamidase